MSSKELSGGCGGFSCGGKLGRGAGLWQKKCSVQKVPHGATMFLVVQQTCAYNCTVNFTFRRYLRKHSTTHEQAAENDLKI